MRTIYLIEGLPGSGKTTLSRRLSAYLDTKNIQHKLFNEGDLHPVDLAWTAIFNESDYKKLLSKFDSIKADILNHSKNVDDTYYVAYTKVGVNEDTKDFYTYCKAYEIYRTDDLDHFFEAHLNLWHKFLKAYSNDQSSYIFECIFLQNHINELILKHDLNQEEMINYFQKFSDMFKDFEVKLFYINQIDVLSSIQKITDERRTDNKALYKDWIDLVIEYFEQIKYGKKKGYIGFEGAIKYFMDRKVLELEIIKHLKMDTYVINLDNDYDKVFNEMIKHI